MTHLIIGGGAAGIKTAEKIRELEPDAKITIVMQDESVHSRCMLHKYISNERDAKKLSFIPENFAEENNIEFKAGRTVSSIDTQSKTVELDNGEKLAYDKLLIATGLNGFIPLVGDLAQANNVHCFRHLSEAKAIKEQSVNADKIVVVGAGLVGIDAAYEFLEIGKDVTVVEMANRIIPLQLDDEAAKEYQDLFEKDGCKFCLGRKVTGTESDGKGGISAILLDDGTKLPCDLAVVAAGERAAIGCIQGTDIEFDRFINVDSHMRTNVKDVFAAGNVTGLSGTWPNAKKQAEVAAYNMCGYDEEYLDIYAFKNTMNFYGLTALSLGKGIVEEGDEVIKQHDSKGYRKAIIRDGRLDSIIIQGKLDYSGVYQYVIKNNIDLSDIKTDIFKLSFADFYGIDENGEYKYVG